MTNEDLDREAWLERALAAGESDQVEFKLRVVADVLPRVIAAFANSRGGTVVVGVEDNGLVVGTDPRQVEQAVVRALMRLDPKPAVKVDVVQREGKVVALVRVEESSDGLVLNEGRAYGRVGPSIISLAQDQIVRLALRSRHQMTAASSLELSLAQEVGRLAAAISSLTARDERPPPPEPTPSKSDDGPKISDRIIRVLTRFHVFATTLARRQRQRSALQVVDEYDLQYLLYALLRLDFDDVRPEEWTPSFAGGASRMDFLLKRENTVVECKLASDGRADRNIADELLIDVGRYQVHPDCRTLVCFVYDPGGHIANPLGMEDDFARLSTDRFQIAVIVAPRMHP